MARIDGLNNVTTVTGYMAWVNVTSSGLAGFGAMLMVWAVLFGITLVRRTWAKSALFASTVCVIIGLPLVIIGLLNLVYYEMFLALWALSGMASVFFDN